MTSVVFSRRLSLLRIFTRAGGRWISSANVRCASTNALVYEAFGQPENVVKLVSDHPVKDMGSEDVTIGMMAFPINPSDINTIQGVYPIKPILPAVGGGEGVGVVLETGNNVTSMTKGDWVIPAGPGLGTWRNLIVAPANKFIKIRSDMEPNLAATLCVNPPTAYRMLKDFVTLKPGDCIIQNGGNSGVGLSVSQLAKAWGLNCVSVIRDRPNLDEVINTMNFYGATEVVTEEIAASHLMKDIMAKYKPPRLAFNCVGGKSSTTLLKHLSHGSVMVNYGGMARQPVTIPVSYLIFKDMKIVGYWNSKWLDIHMHSPAHLTMMDDLCKLAITGGLHAPPTTFHPITDYKLALMKAMEPYVASKQIIYILL